MGAGGGGKRKYRNSDIGSQIFRQNVIFCLLSKHTSLQDRKWLLNVPFSSYVLFVKYLVA